MHLKMMTPMIVSDRVPDHSPLLASQHSVALHSSRHEDMESFDTPTQGRMEDQEAVGMSHV